MWQHPEAATPPMRQWAQFANINGADEVGFGAYPAMDDSIAALVLLPTALVGKDPSCPNKQCRTTDKWLKRPYEHYIRSGAVSNGAHRGPLCCPRTRGVEGAKEGLRGAGSPC